MINRLLIILSLILIRINSIRIQELINNKKLDNLIEIDYDSFTLTPEDLSTIYYPWMDTSESSWISLSDLISKTTSIIGNQTEIAIMILEIGDGSIIDWKLSCPDSKESNTSTNESIISLSSLIDNFTVSVPKIQTYFVTDLPIFHFNADQYTGNPNKVIIADPSCKLSFQTVRNYSIEDAKMLPTTSTLVFAPILIADVTLDVVSTIELENCKICDNFIFPKEFIRMGPYTMQRTEVKGENSNSDNSQRENQWIMPTLSVSDIPSPIISDKITELLNETINNVVDEMDTTMNTEENSTVSIDDKFVSGYGKFGMTSTSAQGFEGVETISDVSERSTTYDNKESTQMKSIEVINSMSSTHDSLQYSNTLSTLKFERTTMPNKEKSTAEAPSTVDDQLLNTLDGVRSSVLQSNSNEASTIPIHPESNAYSTMSGTIEDYTTPNARSVNETLTTEEIPFITSLVPNSKSESTVPNVSLSSNGLNGNATTLSEGDNEKETTEKMNTEPISTPHQISPRSSNGSSAADITNSTKNPIRNNVKKLISEATHPTPESNMITIKTTSVRSPSSTMMKQSTKNPIMNHTTSTTNNKSLSESSSTTKTQTTLTSTTLPSTSTVARSSSTTPSIPSSSVSRLSSMRSTPSSTTSTVPSIITTTSTTEIPFKNDNPTRTKLPVTTKTTMTTTTVINPKTSESIPSISTQPKKRTSTMNIQPIRSSTTSKPPVKQEVIQGIITPSIIDSSIDEIIDLLFSIPALSNYSSNSIRKCWLSDNTVNNIDINSISFNRKTSVITLSVHQSLMEGESTIRCNITASNAELLIESNSTVLFVPFDQYVKTAPGIISSFTSSFNKKISMSFETGPLLTQLEGTAYCISDDGRGFNASLSELSIDCDISSLVEVREYRIYGIRSEILYNSTLINQIPLTVIITDDKTTKSLTKRTTVHTSTILPIKSTTKAQRTTTNVPSTQSFTTIQTTSEMTSTTSTLKPSTPTDNNDRVIVFLDSLLGLSFQSNQQFSMQTFNCSDYFYNHLSFGENATCVSTGKGILITFGSGASIVPGDKIDTTKTFNKQLITPISNLNVAPPLNPIKPNFSLSYPMEVMICVKSINIDIKQITGSGGRDLEYEWRLPNGMKNSLLTSLIESSKARKVTIPTRLLSSDQSMIITAKACNFVNQCTSYNASITLSDSAALFSIAIGGLDTRIVSSKRIPLSASSSFIQCNTSKSPANVQYSWKINGAEYSRSSTYRIPPFTFLPNTTVLIMLEGVYTVGEKQYQAHDSRIITIEIDPLIAIVDATQRTSPIDHEINIDASSSSDPNFASNGLSHSWKCYNISDLSDDSESYTECNLPSSIDKNAPILHIPANVFEANIRLNFSNTIRSTNITSLIATTYSLVDTIAPKSPIIKFESLLKEKVNTDEFIRIRAFVSSSYGSLTTVWRITLDGVDVDISSFLSSPIHTFTEEETSESESLVLSMTIPPNGRYDNWSGLLAGKTYTVSLVALNSKGESGGFIDVNTNSPPIVGDIDFSPDISSLPSLSPFYVSIGDGWYDNDTPLTITFGVTSINIPDVDDDTVYLPSSLSPSASFILPAALPIPHAVCGVRVGYKIIVQVCDRLSACSIGESDQFIIQHTTNLSQSTLALTQQMEAELNNGNTWSALSILEAIRSENCSDSLDSTIANKIVIMLIDSITNTSDINEYREVLDGLTRSMSSINSETMVKVFEFITKYQVMMGMDLSSSSSRKKRSTTTMLTSSSSSSDNSLLAFFDTQLKMNVSTTLSSYFPTIQSILAASCTQLDESTTRIIQQTGGLYSMVQVQALVPGSDGFNTSSYTVAGVTVPVISFDSSFISSYSRWPCDSTSQCLSICLGSLRITNNAVATSYFLQQQLFSNAVSLLSGNRSIFLMNPMSGTVVTDSVVYTIDVPLLTYRIIDYYGCFLFTSDEVWSESYCDSGDYAVKKSSGHYLTCTCTTTGILSVFTVPGPPAPDLPPHNEIRLIFRLNSTSAATSIQRSNFIIKLSNAISLRATRLINPTSVDSSTISITMRPPTKSDDIANNIAVQSMTRVVGVEGGMMAYDSVRATNLTYEVIQRNLTNDGYARKIMMKVDASFSSVVGTGDTSPLESKWPLSITNTMKISQYRVKNVKIDRGVIFNFTFTLPYADESSMYPTISAEELSIFLQETIIYGELQLTSVSGSILTLSNLTAADIIILIPMPQSNSLVLILVIVISTILLLAGLYIGGALLFKARSDFLLEEERKRFIMVDPSSLHPPPPSYPIDVPIPPNDPRDQIRVRTAY